MIEPLLQLDSITKCFGAVRALKGVSFELRAGEVHALLGENGAGKSTLIKIMTGAHQPDSGTIRVGGERVAHLTPAAAHKLGIACIYQQPALFPDLTVAENIALRLEPAFALRRVNWRERHQRAEHLLRSIGAKISTATEVRALSMPEQQLVEIACTLGAGARIVIMDEPTASLTQQEVDLLFGVVRELRSSGVGVVYITHRLEEIFALADRVTVLRDGESVGMREVRARLCNREAPPDTHAASEESENLLSATRCNSPSSAPQLNEAELIRLMVGREVSHMYPPSESAPGQVVLSLRNIGCTTSGLRDVTLDIRAGEIFGLAGLIGAGRSELARVLFGITPADSGEIVLNGRRVTIASARQAVALGIAYVPEDRRRHGVILDMPIAQNMTMAIHRTLFPGSWLRPRRERPLARRFMQELEIKAYAPDAPGNSLSGGNQQKVAVSRWLATNPKVLILDEPTQGVDVGAKSEIHGIIRTLAKQGLAILLISSDLPEIIGMSNRIGVMRNRTLVAIVHGNTDAHEIMATALGVPAPKSRLSDS